MYKIVIADDEKLVREGIKKLINWQELGLDLVGDAQDGQEAYDLINKYKPDIVMMDICMPYIDGLKLAEIINKENIDCEIIIVTGYDEFDYARKALRAGVNDYILKPLTKDEIKEILKKVIRDIDRKREKTNRIENNDSFINKLIESDNKMIEINSLEQSFLKNSRWCSIAVADMDSYLKSYSNYNGEDIRLTDFAISNIIEHVLKETKNGVFFKTYNKENAILLYSNEVNKMAALDGFLDVLNKIKDACKNYLGITISIGIGSIDSIDKIKVSYKEAVKTISYRFFNGKDIILHSSDFNKEHYCKNSKIDEVKNSLIKAIKEMNEKKVVSELDNLSNYMKENNLEINLCKDIFIKTIVIILENFTQMDIDIRNIIEENIVISEKVNTFKNIADIKKWIYDIYVKAVDYIDTHSNSNKLYIAKIKEYIEQNYSNQKLSFQNLSNHMHLSQSYLSSIMKKELGKTFVECLTEIRMRNSLQLLKNTNLKTYEVSEKVGYSDPHYFSSSFKKSFGMSPSDYRKLKR